MTGTESQPQSPPAKRERRQPHMAPRAPLEKLMANLQSTNPTYKLLVIGRLLDRVISRHVKALADLPLAEWKVMAMLGMLKEASAAEISSNSLTDPAEVSRAVNALEEKGLILRDPNPRNRRSTLISLTPAGERHWRETASRRAELTNVLIAVLSEEEKMQLNDMLMRLASTIVAAEESFD